MQNVLNDGDTATTSSATNQSAILLDQPSTSDDQSLNLNYDPSKSFNLFQKCRLYTCRYICFLDSETNSEIDSDTDSDEESEPIQISLQRWCINNLGVTHTAINQLLVILRNNGFVQLPKDARTLLKTPKKLEIATMSEGFYSHVGMAKSILYQMPYIIKKVFSGELIVDINIDGLPITKRLSGWILANIRDDSQSRM